MQRLVVPILLAILVAPHLSAGPLEDQEKEAQDRAAYWAKQGYHFDPTMTADLMDYQASHESPSNPPQTTSAAASTATADTTAPAILDLAPPQPVSQAVLPAAQSQSNSAPLLAQEATVPTTTLLKPIAATPSLPKAHAAVATVSSSH